MATISKYATKKGTRWRVQYIRADRTPSSKQGFPTKAAAQRWLDETQHTINTGTWIDPTRQRITIGELYPIWETTQQNLKPSGNRVRALAWDKHVKPVWQHVPVGSITHSSILEWIGSINGGRSTKTRAHGILSQILEIAVKDGRIPKNPARGVPMPKRSQQKIIFYTVNQLANLAEQAKYPEIIWTLGTTGMRWGELAALRPQDIDLAQRRAQISRNAVTVGKSVIIGTPKTHEKRAVALTDTVAEMLAPLCHDRPLTHLLWYRNDDEPLPIPGSKSWFDGAMERAIARDPSMQKISPHGLRHVAAGLMISAGAHVKVVQRQLGHESAAMTLDTYASLWEEDLDGAAKALNNLLVAR